MADDENSVTKFSGNRICDPRFLTAFHEMVNEHASATLLRRAKFAKDARQIIHTIEEFYDNGCFTQVVSPYFLDEFGIVTSFYEDPARLRNFSPTAIPHNGTGSGDDAFRPGTLRHQGDGFPIDKESVGHRERTAKSVKILQGNDARFRPPEHLTEELRQGVFEEEAFT